VQAAGELCELGATQTPDGGGGVKVQPLDRPLADDRTNAQCNVGMGEQLGDRLTGFDVLAVGEEREDGFGVSRSKAANQVATAAGGLGVRRVSKFGPVSEGGSTHGRNGRTRPAVDDGLAERFSSFDVVDTYITAGSRRGS